MGRQGERRRGRRGRKEREKLEAWGITTLSAYCHEVALHSITTSPNEPEIDKKSHALSGWRLRSITQKKNTASFQPRQTDLMS
jgi:transposase-like protein